MTKARILIVEDEHIVAMDIQNYLERNDYQVAGHVDRGEVAVQIAGELLPDLVLMDISLKGNLDGIEAACQIRSKHNLPVVFLTALANQPTVERARLAEPYGYLLKPFDERELVAVLEMALYKHSMERKLCDSEERFRLLYETMAQGVVYQSANGEIISANPSAERILGLSLDQLQGRTSIDPRWKAIHEDGTDYPGETHPAMLALKTGQEIRNKIMGIFNPQTEEYHWINVNAVPQFKPGEKRPYQVYATFDDFTARRKAEESLRKNEERLRMITENAPSIITELDPLGCILYMSRVLPGYKMDDVLGQHVKNWIPEDYQPIMLKAFDRVLEDGTPQSYESFGAGAQGEMRWYLSNLSPVKVDEQIKSVILVATDITERKVLEENERDQRRLAEALRDTSLIMSSTLKFDDILDRILDNIGSLVHYDTAMVSILEGNLLRKIRYQNNPHETSDRLQIGDLQANLLNVPILQTLIRAKKPLIIPDIQDDNRWQAVDVRGMNRLHSLVCVPIIIQDNVVGVINVVSASPNFFTQMHAERIMAFSSQAAIAMENARLYEQAEHLAVTDPLTELFNMRYFLDFGKLEFERIQRYSRTLSVAMVDIDHFKVVNDTYGHGMGDMVLHEIAARIKGCIRTVDVVARYGGEEFIILMPETSVDEAFLVAERVRQSVAENPIENTAITITLSLGVAEKSKDIDNLDELVKFADHALYEAKAKGRNRTECYSDD